MKYYIGIDLGGTNIKAGVVSDSFEIVSKESIKTNLPRPAEEICADMAKVALMAVESARLTLDDIEAVGIGTPGTANSADGVIEYSNNLGFKDFHVVELMKTFIDKPCYVENDANAAAYGEFIAGAAKGAKNAVCITLGTGVGGGIIIDGKIYPGQIPPARRGRSAPHAGPPGRSTPCSTPAPCPSRPHRSAHICPDHG